LEGFLVLLNNNNNNNNNSLPVKRESKSDASNNRSDWNHFKIRQYLSKIPGKHEIKKLQKTAI
jgi:hypothetical protein